MTVNLFSKIKTWFNTNITKNQYTKEDFTNIKNILLSSDFGNDVSNLFIDHLKSTIIPSKKSIEPDSLLKNCTNYANKLLNQYQGQLDILSNSQEMKVILICGVNGSGKTTTTAKLGWYLQNTQNQKTLLVGCDTFRAAAKNQLKNWSQLANLDFFQDDGHTNCPAALSYKAISYAKNNNYGLVLLDTAGRLNTDIKLMEQLSKIRRVVKKIDNNLPTHSILILDANAGQNCYQQVEQFKKFAHIDGMIITKLDGSAKAGILLGITQKYNIKVYFVGIGEKLNDLIPFKSDTFAHSLFLQN